MIQQNLPLIMRKGSPDDFQTPPVALKPLMPFMNKNYQWCETAVGKGYLLNELKNNGYKIFGFDIKVGGDFLKDDGEGYDASITNPPFSKKNEWIEHCYKIDKPFALLLPLAALETQRRQTQWKKGLQLLVLDKRLHFETPNIKASHCWFASAWFTYKFNLPKDLIFGNP